MTLLNRYLCKRNLFLLVSILFMATGIYILADLFQLMDNFWSAGLGIGSIAIYFIAKMPMIISQVLPAVFLLSVVVQLSLMNKNREDVALQAGGVSPVRMVKFVLFYGLAWALIQLVFSQALGVYGERTASQLYAKEVKGRNDDSYFIEGLWFTKTPFVVRMGKAWPNQERANEVYVYHLTADGLGIENTYYAKSARSSKKDWILQNVEVVTPPKYSFSKEEQVALPIGQNLHAFKGYERKSSNSEMEIRDLWDNIKRLEAAGTNVEAMRTNFHSRFAYAFSIVAMGLLGLVITMRTSNIYMAVILSLICTFAYYVLNTILTTMGESGKIIPYIAVWTTNVIFSAGSLLYLFSNFMQTLRRKI